MAVGLATLFLLGIGAQWLGWRLHLPAILVLLVFGVIAGPVLGILDPDALLGDLLPPLVSIAVALILFEGGLSLELREITNLGRVLFSLVSVGVLVSWGIIASAAYLILGLDAGLSLLLGATLVVTGPTVIGPLLRHVRPTGPAASILKWEGIVIDPIGVALALIVFEVLLTGSAEEATWITVKSVAFMLGVGIIGGVAAAWFTHLILRRYWVPEFLQNPVTLSTVVVVFVASNHVQHESGLLTVTIMGAILANQKTVAIRHIVEFKENLRVLLISSIFILLAARVELSQLRDVGWREAGFLLALILIARPAAVALSTLRSSLGWRDRAFLMWMAPRGVVAAAVSSFFALELEKAGRTGAEMFFPVTFVVIIATVALYGLTATWVARRLGLAGPAPQGVLMVGAHAWARDLAKVLSAQGVRVLLLDSNRENVRAARLEGLEAARGDALADATLHDLDFAGIGRLLAVSPNDEVNVLATQHFAELFGRSEVYRLSPNTRSSDRKPSAAQDARGRILFDQDTSYDYLTARHVSGGAFKATRLSDEFDYEAFKEKTHGTARVLFVKKESGRLRVRTADSPIEPQPGDTLINLSDE